MKKEVFIPVLLTFLGFIFIIINIIVYFSKGNAWAISKKLKIGALILSLTSIFSCGSHSKPTCYELSPSKEYLDSMANDKKQDSIKSLENQKHIDDSIALATKEQKKKDSLAKIKHKKKTPITQPTCYKPAPPSTKTCYAPVRKNLD